MKKFIKYLHMILSVINSLQQELGDAASRKKVEDLMPQKVKKRRKIQTEDGVSVTLFLCYSTVHVGYQLSSFFS